MKGARRQYRIVVYRTWIGSGDEEYSTAWSPRKVFSSFAQAAKHAERYGPEPWKAFGLGPDDHWCEGGATMRDLCGKPSDDPFEPPYRCNQPGRTCREAFAVTRDSTLDRIEIQSRWVSPYETVVDVYPPAREGEETRRDAEQELDDWLAEGPDA